MVFDPELHHRRSIRLRGYDYSQPGTYFITICTAGKEHLFGEVVEGEMVSNEPAQIVQRTWANLPRYFPNIRVDEFIVMPNHVHGIVEILGATLGQTATSLVGAGLALPSDPKTSQSRAGAASSAPTLGYIVRVFKSKTAIAVNSLIGRSGKPLWQRNYYEHIVRNAEDLETISNYIQENPARWPSDPENLL